ncbi:hypothetical protein [Fimbriimonas ginsengisoli]|uniref:Putative transmembrane protein n=1 Tax=Fimbriimonas ginsengisoli Gsoil 348 TaxID=661478 RepID=A0A068NWI8_FIMGI|nr:hypothetical protein [Fimbriimonas ginsengisoli]AIE87816.1 putative transmembrane protein [Fimbriimonas ginsengisoli Gsoil 348]
MLPFLAAGMIALAGLHGRVATERMWGVTLDEVSDTSAIVESLRGLKAKMTARVVFDPGATPREYASAVHEIGKVADVMGSPVDSAPPSGKMSVDAYRKRMADFMDGLGTDVNLWEIGNEVNGDWTGDSRQMGLKIEAALHEAKKRRHKAALCLFYSDYYLGTDREMAKWSEVNLSDDVKRHVDYVLVSFYPASATGEHPDWKAQFKRLGEVFPKAKLGFGELGLRKEDFTLSNDESGKEALIRRYYRMASPLPGRFVGGYFWWTFRQDAVAKNAPLWTALKKSIG